MTLSFSVSLVLSISQSDSVVPQGSDEASDCIDCEPGKYALAGSDVIIAVGGMVIFVHPCELYSSSLVSHGENSVA